MKCGNCNKTDGVVYISYPPKVKCTVSGRFHFLNDECDNFADEKKDKEMKLDLELMLKAAIATYQQDFDEWVRLRQKKYSSYFINPEGEICVVGDPSKFNGRIRELEDKLYIDCSKVNKLKKELKEKKENEESI